MKKNNGTAGREPSKASLRAMPEADFSKPGWRRAPEYAAQIQKDGGYTVAVDGKKPYFVRVGAGRPKRGEKVEPTTILRVRLPVTLLQVYKASAKANGTTVNAEIGAALVAQQRRRA